MATNTIGGCNAARISQITLDVLKTMPIPLSAFTTDFSAEVKDRGESVTTRVVTAPTVVNFAAARSTANSTITAKTVTLSNYVGIKLGFNDKDSSLSDVRLGEQFIAPGLTAIFENVFANVMALVVNATFNANTVIAAANFSAANVAGLCSSLNTAKVPLNGRSIIVPPSYALVLKKDSALQASYAYGNNQVITEGRVPRVYGFDVHEYNGTIPNNSENLAGVALAKQALIIAARPPQTPVNWYGQTVNVTDPESGLTIQYRDYYDGTEQVTEMCLIYGTAAGVTGNLHRILSA